MNKKSFVDLVDSLHEGGEILRGTRKAARSWAVADGKRIETKEDIQSIRHEFGVSQSAFAKLMGVSVNTLQNWEQGRRQPTGAARVLLTIAVRRPAVFREAMSVGCHEFA